MSNLLKVIKFIIDNPVTEINSKNSDSTNRINAVGQSLECYIQNVFCEAIDTSSCIKSQLNNQPFSYIGNQNNPPDLMIKHGDAIEIKKIQTANASLALNSSYPKDKLYANNPMLTNNCKTVEDWIEKDLLYVVGHIEATTIKYLWFIYGDCFCADKSVYEKIKNIITIGINQIPDVELSETNELARINKVDPLGITALRVRGMWHIDNPNKIFSYLKPIKDLDNTDFKIICLMKTVKFDQFSDEDKQALKNHKQVGYSFNDVKIKNPNNPAQLIDCKLITYHSNQA
ncbi:MAG: hypothetical protein RL344_1186 [Pseudomonadota bacterium]|jgi:hypothetical protein